jgi:hypothetical protein
MEEFIKVWCKFDVNDVRNGKKWLQMVNYRKRKRRRIQKF